jgi:predicted TIM-barrel fold metal-dependent hydrolase
MIVDAHTHIGYWRSLEKTKDCLLSLMHTHDVNYAITSIDASEFKSLGKEFAPKTLRLNQIELNTKTLEFAKQNPCIFPLIWIKPNREYREKSIKTLDEFISINRDHIYGLKVHPWCSRIRMNDRRLLPFLALARKYNLPILVHTAKDKYADIKYLKEVALANPDLTFIAAHLQLLSDHSEGVETLKNVPNIYGDTAWVDISVVQQLIKLGLEDKIMFGTDCPIDKDRTYDEDIYQNYFKNKKKIKRSIMDKVMYKNAIRIYKLPIK